MELIRVYFNSFPPVRDRGRTYYGLITLFGFTAWAQWWPDPQIKDKPRFQAGIR